MSSWTCNGGGQETCGVWLASTVKAFLDTWMLSWAWDRWAPQELAQPSEHGPMCLLAEVVVNSSWTSRNSDWDPGTTGCLKASPGKMVRNVFCTSLWPFYASAALGQLPRCPAKEPHQAERFSSGSEVPSSWPASRVRDPSSCVKCRIGAASTCSLGPGAHRAFLPAPLLLL